jgi:thioredoxin-related protein
VVCELFVTYFVFSFKNDFTGTKQEKQTILFEMKKTILIFLGLTLIIGCTAQSQKSTDSAVKWYTFEEAVKLNETTPKKIFVDVYTDWCSWCKVMDQKTFSHPEIAAYLNKHYYPVKFDAESTKPITFKDIVFENTGEGRRSPHQLAAALLQGKMSYPSIAYLDENNQLLTAVPGYYTPAQIEPILVFFAEDHYKNKNWETFSQSFKGKIKEE